MRALALDTIPNYLAQSTGQVTAITLLTALITVFIVFTVIGAMRHPSGPGLINLLILVSCMFVGWAAARWPGVDHTQGMFLGIFHMWLDAMRICLVAFLNLIGADGLAEALDNIHVR